MTLVYMSKGQGSQISTYCKPSLQICGKIVRPAPKLVGFEVDSVGALISQEKYRIQLGYCLRMGGRVCPARALSELWQQRGERHPAAERKKNKEGFVFSFFLLFYLSRLTLVMKNFASLFLGNVFFKAQVGVGGGDGGSEATARCFCLYSTFYRVIESPAPAPTFPSHVCHH